MQHSFMIETIHKL